MPRTLGRNDRCWCGSGRKFKHCHMRREEGRVLPPNAIAAQYRKHFRAKTCLHPNASRECGQIISAHTIQRSGALANVTDANNSVLTFYPLTFENDQRPKLHSRGWRKASTFTGFCDKHDNATFAPIEDSPFVASPQQCFLIAYRALCHELYQKTAAVESYSTIRDIVDQGLPPETQQLLQDRFAIMHAGATHGLANSKSRKQSMDNQLLSSSFGGWHHFVVEFEGDTSIVSTGTITPNYDLSGRPLQALHDPNATIQYLHFGVVPIDRGGAIVFSWTKEDRKMSQFVAALRDLPEEWLPNVIAQLMLLYCENTYFSSQWWNSRETSVREHLGALAANSNPYYNESPLLNSGVVPWTVTQQHQL